MILDKHVVTQQHNDPLTQWYPSLPLCHFKVQLCLKSYAVPLQPHFQASMYLLHTSSLISQVIQGIVCLLSLPAHSMKCILLKLPQSFKSTGLSSIPKSFHAFALSGTWHYSGVQKALRLPGSSAYCSYRPRKEAYWLLNSDEEHKQPASPDHQCTILPKSSGVAGTHCCITCLDQTSFAFELLPSA